MCLCALQSRQKRPEVRDILFALELLPRAPRAERRELRPASKGGLPVVCPLMVTIIAQRRAIITAFVLESPPAKCDTAGRSMQARHLAVGPERAGA